MKPKIAHLVPWMQIGGTERIIFELCRLGGGHQWVVAGKDGPMRSIFERSGIEVRVANNFEDLSRHMIDADVVNWHALVFDPYLFAALLKAAKPVVFILHWCSVLPELPALILCTSKNTYQLQEPNRERRILIPNGIDTTVYHPQSIPRKGSIRLIRVCRAARCAEYFWPALYRVLEACPNVQLTIIGGVPYRVGRVESLGVRQDVPQLLASSHIFVYTPQPNEGTLDLVVLEAMASGLACVLSNVPCVNEAVQDGITALLTPFGDGQAFAESVIRLVKDQSLAQALGQRAAELARERFDIRQRLPLYQAAYERAFSENQLPSQLPYWRERFVNV